jgi:hypothetical protein
MASPDNYFPGSGDMNPAERLRLVMDRMKSVIEGTELIRRECNRIRNELLSLGLPIDTELLGLIAHLQVDVIHLRVKYGYMTGLKGEELNALLYHLENPISQLSNEDPPKR